MINGPISRIIVTVALVAAMALSVLTAVSASPAAEPTVDVAMADNTFQPQTITVQEGLPGTGDDGPPPVALLLAGSILVIGLALRRATSD